ncbi:chymotrypsin inhibitor-like [Andrena cerasifolii]|uniref:chymotrypsin inhibitor-like n=1 Tax=Andrena cerasifolii TaxID=2819439 RepID=UPI004037AF25
MSPYIVVAVLFVVAVAPAYSGDHYCIGCFRNGLREVYRCPVNETMSQCGRLCEPTCESSKATSEIYECPLIECTEETTGCRCKEGFFRNVQGLCVDSDDCPK